MFDLNDPRTLVVDRGGMLSHIATAGSELERAWRASAGFGDALEDHRPRNVVVCGIGGSATAADYFAAICRRSAPIPVEVVRGYELPAHAGPGTLLIACSYSGNTDETLAATVEGLARGAALVAITRGGELRRLADAHGAPHFSITYAAPPRATTMHTLAPLLRLGLCLGLTSLDEPGIILAASAHTALVEQHLAPRVPFHANRAKQIASAVQGRLPILLGAEHLIPAANRFKNQLAENGKMLAAADSLPEAGHNLVVGLGTASVLASRTALLTLESPCFDDRVVRRFNVVAEQFGREGVPVHRIKVAGHSVLEDLLLATAWGDYVSVYAALAAGIDPTPIPQIEEFRAALRRG